MHEPLLAPQRRSINPNQAQISAKDSAAAWDSDWVAVRKDSLAAEAFDSGVEDFAGSLSAIPPECDAQEPLIAPRRDSVRLWGGAPDAPDAARPALLPRD